MRFGTESPQALLTYFDNRLQKGDYPLKDAAIYGKALALLQLKRTDEADALMQELATRHPEDLFVVDALTDIDLAKGRSAQAIARLEKFRTRMPDNEVVVVNLGNAYGRGQLQEVHRHSRPLCPRARREQPGLEPALRCLSQGWQDDRVAHGTGRDALPAR